MQKFRYTIGVNWRLEQCSTVYDTDAWPEASSGTHAAKSETDNYLAQPSQER